MRTPDSFDQGVQEASTLVLPSLEFGRWIAWVGAFAAALNVPFATGSGGDRCRLTHRAGKHDSRNAAEDEADANQCADDPDGTRWPVPPDEDAENKRDDSIEQDPP